MTILPPLRMKAGDILRENALQLPMYLLETILTGLIWFPLGVMAYCLLSNVLYMAWVCPCCAYYSLGTYPAGFHILSSRRFKPKPGQTFSRKFRKNVIVMFPGWFLPPVIAIYPLVVHFSWPVLALPGAFCVIGFWLLPEASKEHCEGCATVDRPRRPKTLATKP